MNAKQRSILAGRKPKLRYSVPPADEKLVQFGISPLRDAYTAMSIIELTRREMEKQLMEGLGLPASVFRGDRPCSTPFFTP